MLTLHLPAWSRIDLHKSTPFPALLNDAPHHILMKSRGDHGLVLTSCSGKGSSQNSISHIGSRANKNRPICQLPSSPALIRGDVGAPFKTAGGKGMLQGEWPSAGAIAPSVLLAGTAGSSGGLLHDGIFGVIGRTLRLDKSNLINCL